ncbi:MAG: prepilin-type N-terminal cleavage/methylation domain-containing protein [Planctomycetes bacterium]|nr:prepilin-type N-terminal cleavage/methylation domain-containing protein [Planctomycetota bacterium]
MRAFSLIELLVAIMLSLVIAYAAYAGFQVAAKTMSVAHNLRRENRVLTEGFAHAMVEADYWYAEDDPRAATGQPLRRAYDAGGNPATVGRSGSHGQPFVAIDLPDEYWNWKVSDPRTWSRMGFLKCVSYQGNPTGSYAQVGCIGHPTPRLPGCTTCTIRCSTISAGPPTSR